jgi:hypothetical protein
VAAREVNKARAQAEGEAGGKRSKDGEDKETKKYIKSERIGLNYNNRVFIFISYLRSNREIFNILSIIYI